MQWILLILFLSPFGLPAQRVYSTRELKDGKFRDDSSYVYRLPFLPGKKVFVIQGYESMFSHKGLRAIDFKVKTGTKIFAARGGVVTATREDSDRRGLKPQNLADGNYIFIRHDDGSVANYWHFKKDGVLVSSGDTVLAGQLIGLSGNTGYSAFPHLHFEVQGYDAALKEHTQLATRFATRNGVFYLRAGQFYRNTRN